MGQPQGWCGHLIRSATDAEGNSTYRNRVVITFRDDIHQTNAILSNGVPALSMLVTTQREQG